MNSIVKSLREQAFDILQKQPISKLANLMEYAALEIESKTAERDNLARLLKEGAGLVNEYAAENDRLTAAHIESIEAMKASHKEDIETYKAEQAFLGMAISILKSDKEKQAAEIAQLTEKVRYAYVQTEALERVK